jgi:hypothetical protein
MFFGRFLITFNCLLYIAIALWVLFAPHSFLQGSGVEIMSRAALIEMQVLVAGSFLGFCILLSNGILDKRKTKRSLITLFIINAAWLLTRCLALIEGWSQENSTYLYMGFELATLILVLIALRQENGQRGRTLFRQEEASF